jgi:hypothetical protein
MGKLEKFSFFLIFKLLVFLFEIGVFMRLNFCETKHNSEKFSNYGKSSEKS